MKLFGLHEVKKHVKRCLWCCFITWNSPSNLLKHLLVYCRLGETFLPDLFLIHHFILLLLRPVGFGWRMKTYSVFFPTAHRSNTGVFHIHPDGVGHHLLEPKPWETVEGYNTERWHQVRGDCQNDVGYLVTRHIHALGINNFALIEHLSW